MSEHRVAVYFDIENLCHPFRSGGRVSEGIDLMASFLGDLRQTNVVVSALGVCDRDTWRRVAFPLNDLGVRVFAHGGGVNAADAALVAHIRGELPPSVGTVVIASGDHFFAGVARELRHGGRQVVVASLRHALSNQLYRAANSAHVFSVSAAHAA
jgi:hypothetical protein